MLKIIKNNENEIYKDYMEIMSYESKKIKHWITGESIIYKGEEYIIKREKSKNNKISISIEENNKQMKIIVPVNITDEQILKENIDRGIKQLLKNNTTVLIQERLPYWSEKTGIKYDSFKVRDTTSKFGSCSYTKKKLNFAARLIMLPRDKVDAIIVHELCHIIHPNHSKKFYDLVKKYIPDYEQIDKWLHQNTKLLVI